MPNRAPARCRRTGCGAEIAFFRSPFTGNVRAFDAKPIDGRNPTPDAYPIYSRTAYKFAVLVELIQVQRQCSDVEAEAEVRDMPWHTIHDCTGLPPASTTDPDHEPEKEITHP